MPSRLAAAVLLAALGAAACSGGGSNDLGEIVEESTSTTITAPAPTGDTIPPKERPASCDALEEAAGRVAAAVQIVVQLRSVDQYNLIKQGAIALDTTQVSADLKRLRALQSVAIAETHGDVTQVLDNYEIAAGLARTNLAVEDPFAEGNRGPELLALIQDVGGFLRGQVAIGVALDELDCT